MYLQNGPEKEWPLCLEAPPQVIQMGIGVHGQEQIERYLLPDLWCLHLYRYDASVQIGGQEFPIQPGFVSIIPAATPVVYRFQGRSTHLYVHFRAATDSNQTVSVPAMQNFSDDFGRLYSQLEQVVHSEPNRVQARVWDVLWQVAERGVPGLAAGLHAHPAVGKALRVIEKRLGDSLRVASLAAEVGVSDSYLTRLFQDALGLSVAGYIRHRRVQRAAHLLRHSTLPVKAIAVLVGLPDLHQFNKTLHHCLGQSPRAVRRTASCLETASCIVEPIVI